MLSDIPVNPLTIGIVIIIARLLATATTDTKRERENEEWACTSNVGHGKYEKTLERGKDDEEIEYRKSYRDYLRRYYKKHGTYDGAEPLHDLGLYKWDYSDVDNPHKSSDKWSDYESPHEVRERLWNKV